MIQLLEDTFIPTLVDRNGADAFPGAVRVVYTTATGMVPATVSRACADLVGHWYRQAKTHAATGHLDVGEKGGA